MSTNVPSFPRRVLLAGGAGLAAAAGVGSLAGCNSGGGGKSSNDTSANASVALPTYIAYEGAKPDLPSSEDGVESGFYKYPSDRPASVSAKPGKGGEKLTGISRIYTPAPGGPDQNPWWAGLNERLGVDLGMIMVPAADYPAKFATTIAGGDLPDMMQMEVVANYPQLLDKRFTPLDEYLSGDAIKDYPNLANVPTFTWKQTVYNGHIYGIPIPRGRVGSYDFIRPDIFAKAGVDQDVKGGWDGFVEAMKALTSAKDRRWAIARAGSGFNMVQRINECANRWVEDGGNLTSVYETEQYKQAIQDTAALWKAGVMHPDAFNTQLPWKQLFSSGNISVNNDGYLAWWGYAQSNAGDPKFKQGLMTMTNRDGSKPSPWYPGSGIFAINALTKQSDPEKIKLALRVCDYLAAPFGTEEEFYLSYGKEGRDHKVVNGEPVKTDKGVTDIAVPVGYVADGPHVLYESGRPQDMDVQHKYMTRVLPESVLDPTEGLFSNTQATDAAPANTALNDATNDIIQARKPLSAFDDAVKAWKSAAGDKMRDEFAAQLQAKGGPDSKPS